MYFYDHNMWYKKVVPAHSVNLNISGYGPRQLKVGIGTGPITQNVVVLRYPLFCILWSYPMLAMYPLLENASTHVGIFECLSFVSGAEKATPFFMLSVIMISLKLLHAGVRFIHSISIFMWYSYRVLWNISHSQPSQKCLRWHWRILIK